MPSQNEVSAPKTDSTDSLENDITRLTSFPFPCPNCDQTQDTSKIFCSELCRQEAKHVRYERNCKGDGRYYRSDVQEAIQIRRAFILSGGYPEDERRISDDVRQAIIQRDKGTCQVCGKPGNQIDHIQSSSNEVSNLQLLCDACHRQKTTAAFIPITPETHPQAWAKARALDARVESEKPCRLCDSSEWEGLWRRIAAQRRQVIKLMQGK